MPHRDTTKSHSLSAQNNKGVQKNNSQTDYFYFDLADPSHQALQKAAEEKAKEDPMAPLEHVTDVEY